MRRNYFLGGIVGAVAGSAIKGLLGGDSKGSGTGSGGSTKLQAYSFLEESAQQAYAALEEGRQRRKQENPVENLIAKLLTAYEDEGGKREDLNKYWNA